MGSNDKIIILHGGVHVHGFSVNDSPLDVEQTLFPKFTQPVRGNAEGGGFLIGGKIALPLEMGGEGRDFVTSHEKVKNARSKRKPFAGCMSKAVKQFGYFLNR